MRAALRFTKRAEHDWRKLDVAGRERVELALEALRAIPRRANLDEKPLEGASPWRRLRVGGRRIIFRPFTKEESRVYGADSGYIVERVIDRRDLDRAVKSLR